jgi:hypothetical protein
VVGSFEHGNDPSGFIKDWLSAAYYQLLKEDSIPCGQLVLNSDFQHALMKQIVNIGNTSRK